MTCCPTTSGMLLRHVSVFPDGLDLATAEAVAADLDPGSSPLDALAHLVDSSMLEMSPGPPTRYRMLDTVRTFANDELTQRGEAPAATERFLRWALDLAAWILHATYSSDEGHVDRRAAP